MKNPRKGIVREGRYKNRSHKNKEFQRERTKKRREREGEFYRLTKQAKNDCMR
jgi:hypothetical protein